jgi:hypothetical protein
MNFIRIIHKMCTKSNSTVNCIRLKSAHVDIGGFFQSDFIVDAFWYRFGVVEFDIILGEEIRRSRVGDDRLVFFRSVLKIS